MFSSTSVSLKQFPNADSLSSIVTGEMRIAAMMDGKLLEIPRGLWLGVQRGDGQLEICVAVRSCAMCADNRRGGLFWSQRMWVSATAPTSTHNENLFFMPYWALPFESIPGLASL